MRCRWWAFVVITDSAEKVSGTRTSKTLYDIDLRTNDFDFLGDIFDGASRSWFSETGGFFSRIITEDLTRSDVQNLRQHYSVSSVSVPFVFEPVIILIKTLL